MPSVDESTKAHILKHLVPIAPADPIVGQPLHPSPEPVFPTFPRFLVSSLPLTVMYQPDALRQFYRGGVPQMRLIPITR